MIIKGDDAYTLKKANVAYWDELDASVEEEVDKILKKLEGFSTTPINLYGSCYTEEDIAEMDDEDRKEARECAVSEISKEVTSLLVEMLEKHYGATFPFVDCDY